MRYKDLMTGYQNKVSCLADSKQKEEVQLVVNLFQSVLDGFIRGEMKKEEAEPAKVKHSTFMLRISPSMKNWNIHACSSAFQPAKARKKRRKKDKSVSLQLNPFFPLLFCTSNWSNISCLPVLTDGESSGSRFRKLSGQHYAVMWPV